MEVLKSMSDPSITLPAVPPTETPTYDQLMERAQPTTATEGKYVIPRNRTAGGRPEAPPGRGYGDEFATVRVTNLSEETRESDVSDLFRRFGPIKRIYLGKDKTTGQCKGFAFVNFYEREHAARYFGK